MDDKQPSTLQDTKAVPLNEVGVDASTTPPDLQGPSKQYGVQVAEATTSIWTKQSLVTLYLLMVLVQFMQSFAGGMVTTLNPYVTSSFSRHSLTATTGIIANLAAGLFKLPFAKILDGLGRPQGLAIATASQVVGLIMLAACNSVETYCAGQVFFEMGLQCILSTLIILVVDSSKLRHRAMFIGVLSIPSLATAWAFGPAAQSALSGIGWRWALGILAIFCPLSIVPLLSLLWWYAKKVERDGLVTPAGKDKTAFLHRVARVVIEYDLCGILILALGLAFFLLSFNLWTFQADSWRSPMIIAFIVVGGLLLIAFVIYEWRFAPVPFIEWKLLRNRTVIGTYAFTVTLFMGSFSWTSFLYSMLIVVWGLSVTDSTYIINIQTVGAAFSIIVLGTLLSIVPKPRIKWIAFGIGMPLYMLGVGLLYHFRFDGAGIGFIAMTQIFTALGGGIMALAEQLTLMAVSPHQQIGALIATEGVMNSIGLAIGSTVATAIWTGEFPKKLVQFLPPNLLPHLPVIYGSLPAQASFPKGSPASVGIDRAYSVTEGYEIIAALCFCAVSWGFILLWEDVDLAGKGSPGQLLA
ncbi:hypothetical protein PRZ48_003880 [Zasmidium cellare]|uniref:Major facilitator superfamily (MFS) profile domain-containing protein n=1 Tax=Zasmidium cellare TaxID=395010 RepID=A0ABR0EXD4_ZASCE|nr:hypothetical protein PRZ48_003880 [Zasmidium cellare]